MAEGADCGSLNPGKRRQPAGRKSRQSRQSQHKKPPSSRVSLEKVLGIGTASSSSLTSDPNSGLIAYPAGCVIVLLHPKTNKQSHITNTSRKPFSALAFSHDGKYLVTGESGHMPCVRVWEVDGGQVAEVQSHKYGVSCVAFSTNSCYIVSVGYQHDMTVSVWDWRKGSVIASNKVSSRVSAVSFSRDNSYFVTAGNRHVKFWYLDASKERRVNSTVPLIGRSGLLGDHKNNVFSGVACGRGPMASSTYCITSSGLLCLFNSSRQLEAWVNLKTSSASSLAVSADFIFCGCADGVVRVFSPSNLQYITTLQRPHRLGVDLTQSVQHGSLSPANPGAQYPDTLALTFDPAARLLTCVYNDHSVYVWDVKDVRNVGKLYSALYHSSCVWSVEVYPELSDASQACLPPSSFLTCSSDNTIRLWHTDPPTGHRNLYSNDLLRILYVGENTEHLQAEGERGEAAGADGKAGIRVLGISPDGQHLAAGDRCGNLRIFGLEFLDELVKIEAHDSEVLCLEFSPISTGVKLLASASRDRLIHIFNLEQNYSLEQTLNDHSASITAVKFTGESPEVRMVSCGADKSIYFQTAERMPMGLSFSRSHHVVEKTTLYDMDLDSSRTHVAIACQDRNIRVYNVETGKLKKCLKGSSSDEGALLKVQMDPSGSFFATSCSDKNITVFDYESGECVATLFGHSEIVTCMRFSQDCRHLITVSGDSCVFVWRLDSQMTSTMRKRRGLKRPTAPETCSRKQQNIRRETFITVPSSQLPQMDEEEADLRTPDRPDSAHDAPLLQTNGKLPMWFRKLGQGGASSGVQSDAEPRQVRSRWAEQPNPLSISSIISPSPTNTQEEEADLGTPARLDSAHDAPLLQTNGKLPMWFRKLQGQGGASSGVQSDTEPRQVRSRWAEQPNPLSICAISSPSPTKSQEEEEEEEDEDFHPQSLESLLGGEEEEDDEDEDGEEEEKKEVLQDPGEDGSTYNTNNATTDREFDVEAVAEPRRSLSQLEVKGQGAEPVWSTQLSPDSAYCEDLAGSLEQQHDADTDSLSQGSSVGSLCLEDDEDRNSLKNHFDTLASSLNDEKFDTDLRNLQPPEEKPFLNSRLSISTRFLSRFQERIRAWPSRAPPPVSIPTRISEESNVGNTSVSSESSNDVTSSESKENNNGGVRCSRSIRRHKSSCTTSHQSPRRPLRRRHTMVVVQCREALRDVTSRTLLAHNSSLASAVQHGGPRLGYLGTTASSRAKLSQDTPTSTEDEDEEKKKNVSCSSDLQPPSPLLSAGLDLHSTKTEPHQDQTSSDALSSQELQHHMGLATPTEVRSLGEVRGLSVSSVEETLTNLNQTLILSPTPSITPRATPSTCDITCPANRQEEGSGGSETRIQSDLDPSLGAEVFFDPPTSSSSPLSETLRPVQTGSGGVEESVSLQQCQQVANELRQTARRAVLLYQQLSESAGGSEPRLQMSSVLQEAFDVVHSELRKVLPAGDGRGSGALSGGLQDDGTTSLLEKYSELLVQMTQNKLNRI
ncbi:WD repeat-containing protein 62 isoform X4 [Micropterus salmoides]|uniref:WD repeat-containing protein 62 isoform X4 n=1 Tax=Micropterus salmoides TaxID=27706 RepID=UPI0018EE146B|nr:WD repeat-containing protein 62 isoform X4 [Micropterus salmoides]